MCLPTAPRCDGASTGAEMIACAPLQHGMHLGDDRESDPFGRIGAQVPIPPGREHAPRQPSGPAPDRLGVALASGRARAGQYREHGSGASVRR